MLYNFVQNSVQCLHLMLVSKYMQVDKFLDLKIDIDMR